MKALSEELNLVSEKGESLKFVHEYRRGIFSMPPLKRVSNSERPYSQCA
jgi:hypothetical protein